MTRRAKGPHYIKPETICIGDTIKVVHDFLDAKSSIQGVVHHRDVGNYSTYYYTREGVELLNHVRYTPDKKYRVILVYRDETRLTLPEMDI